jgi:prepilin-type N-terminal cleavage/methylation domain-containing protein
MVNRNDKAFTLVELSIVLVIIGLIVGGVVGGQSLIDSSKITSLLSQKNKFATVTRTFEDQYYYFPGDMLDATDYWPGQTINGDGDRKIERPNSGSNPPEHFLVWEHLSLAGMVASGISAGQFSSGSSSWSVRNIPETPYDDVFMSLATECIKIGSNCTDEIRTSITFGKYNGSDEGQYTDSAFTPKFTKTLDKKIDDGIPRSGNLVGANGRTSSGCVTSGTGFSTGTTYNLSNEDERCALYFQLD